jgi:cell division protein FtsQ
VIVVVLGAFGALALAWGVTLSPLLAVEQIKVNGTSRATPDAVIAASGVREGDAMVWLDPDAVTARLEASPWVKAARVQRDWPRTFIITVTERTPAAWAATDGAPGALLVDRSGRVLERAEAPPAGLPKLVDLREVPQPGGKVVPSDGAAVAAAYGKDVVAVREIAVGDGGVVVRLVSGPEVRLGPPTRLGTKLRAAGAVLESLRDNPPTYVDVSVPTNPVAG